MLLFPSHSFSLPYFRNKWVIGRGLGLRAGRRECWHKRHLMICHLIESIQPSEVLLWFRVKAQSCNGLAICRAINYLLYWGTISVNRQSRAGELHSASATTTDLCCTNHRSCRCLPAPSLFCVFRLRVKGHSMWLKRGFNLSRLLTARITINHRFQDKERAWQAAVAPGYAPKGCTSFPSMVWWEALCTWLLSPHLPLKGLQPTGITAGDGRNSFPLLWRSVHAEVGKWGGCYSRPSALFSNTCE